MAGKLPQPETIDTTSSTWSRPDDRFLPVRACDLVNALAADSQAMGVSEEEFRRFAEALHDVIDGEAARIERQLTDRYAQFNPDRETCPPKGSEEPTPDDYDQLHRQLAFVLDKANYDRLDQVQIEQAVLQSNSRSLSVRVDPTRIELLEVWIRGQGSTTHVSRRWWCPWRLHYEHVPVFRRLVVIARLKDDTNVMLKVFKEIPEADVEALLPHAEVTMSLLDRIKLLGSSAGTLGLTVTKLFKLFAALAALWYLAWILIVGLVTLGVRAVLGYRNARTHRDWQRTRHLYFQNLGNNASALQLLVSTFKQEECKEVLLAYSFALRCALAKPASGEAAVGPPDVRKEIEAFFAREYDEEVDFDWADAESKLERLGLWQLQSWYQVVPIDVAIERLRATDRPVLHEEVDATVCLASK